MMSEETGQDLSRMEQSAVASSSALVSSSESAPTSASSSSSSPRKETQLVLSSSSIGASSLSPQPSKAAANNSTYKQSTPSSFHPSPSSSLQKNVVTSFSSNVSNVNFGSPVTIGEVATEIQVKSSHDIDKSYMNGCHQTMNNSQSSTTLSTANLTLPAANVSTMETPITTDSIQIPAPSQTGVAAMTGSVNGCSDGNNGTSSQQNNVLVQHQQQFQQAVTSGMAQQTSGCFNVQMNSDPGHGALQQTTTMQGVLQQTVVVSDNVAVQQRVAVAQETVSQQIVHPVSTATAVAQVAGAEQQQQQQQQTASQPQQPQTASFQLHQPVGNTLANQPTFQLANLGQSLIAPQNFQSLVAQPGTIFNGTQIFCTPDLTRTQQIDVPSMGCQQFLAPTNTFTGGHMVSGVPQVQLVQTGPNQFIQQQCLQQQFMFQSMPGLQNNGVTIQQQHQTTQQQQQQASITNFQQHQQTQQTQQAEGSTKTQTILPATSSQQQPQQNLSCMQQTQQQNTPHQNMSMIRLAVSGSYTIPQQTQQPQALSVKGLATVLPQQTTMNICNNNNINQKQLLQKQPQQPLLFGTIGMLQNQTIQQQPQQPTLYQQQRPLNLGSMGPAAQFTIGNNGALRFAHAPSFITNTGQLLSTNQTVLNLGQIQVPLMNQQLLVTPQGGGTTTLLGSQPLYIRTADAFSTQQGVVGNVQQLQPIQQVKNIANIAPQTAAVINQVNPQPRRGDKNGGGSSGSQQSVGKSGHKSGSGKLQSIAKSSSLNSASVSSSASTVTSTNNNQVQQNATLNSVPGMTTAASALQNNSFVPSSPSSAGGQGKLNQSSVALPSDRSPPVRVQDDPAASRPHPAVIVVQPKQQQPFEEKRQAEKMEVDGNASCTNGKQHQEKDKNFASFSSPNPSARGNAPTIEECSDEGRNDAVQQAALPMKEEDQDEQRLVIVEEPSDRSPAKAFRKSEKKKRKRASKPKVLTHIIEGFIIQEATEPFPVNRTPVSNQFLSSSLKSSSLESLIKESATGNRSGDRLEDSSTEEEDGNNNDDDDETEDESVPSSKKIKLGDHEVKQGPGDRSTPANASSNDDAIQPSILVRTGHEVPVNVNQQVQLAPMNLTASNLPRQHIATNVKHVPTPQTTTSSQQRLVPFNKAQDRSSATHLICEFCGEMGLAETFPCSKRFCSVSCSKRFSAHSNKFKQAAEHGHGSSGTDAKQVSMMSVIKGSKRPLGQSKSHQQGTTTDRGPTTATVAASIHIPASVAPSIPVGNNNMLLTASNLQQFDHNLQQPQQQQQQQHLSYSMPTTAVTPNKQNQLQNPSTTSPGTKQQPAGNAAGDDLAGVHCPDKPLSQWSVNDVYDFVASLPGCGTYAQEFRQQEIDGSALGLLKEDHLMTTLNVKLGPALKICAVVNSLKTE